VKKRGFLRPAALSIAALLGSAPSAAQATMAKVPSQITTVRQVTGPSVPFTLARTDARQMFADHSSHSSHYSHSSHSSHSSHVSGF